MTIQQTQGLLLFLGLYDGAVDGIWGPLSEAASARFRQRYGCAPEEAEIEITAPEGTGPEANWWEQIQHFTRQEFACKCGRYCDGYPAAMDENLIRIADAVRAHFGRPALVSSGLRCKRHNEAVGGVSNSRHLTGKAMDFYIPGVSAGDLLAYVQQIPGIRYAYAIDGSCVHMDVQ